MQLLPRLAVSAAVAAISLTTGVSTAAVSASATEGAHGAAGNPHSSTVARTDAGTAISSGATDRQSTPNGTAARGTNIDLENRTGKPIWVSQWGGSGTGWSVPDERDSLKPGHRFNYAANRVGSDDVELRIFLSYSDVLAKKKYVDVEAENPVWSAPWMAVAKESDVYFDLWQEHTFKETQTHEADQSAFGAPQVAVNSVEMSAKRWADTKDCKWFSLSITKYTQIVRDK